MATEQTQLAEGLLKALQAERDGHSFYNMAATSSQDPKAKEASKDAKAAQPAKREKAEAKQELADWKKRSRIEKDLRSNKRKRA